jgi:hypothetical protein
MLTSDVACTLVSVQAAASGTNQSPGSGEHTDGVAGRGALVRWQQIGWLQPFTTSDEPNRHLATNTPQLQCSFWLSAIARLRLTVKLEVADKGSPLFDSLIDMSGGRLIKLWELLVPAASAVASPQPQQAGNAMYKLLCSLRESGQKSVGHTHWGYARLPESWSALPLAPKFKVDLSSLLRHADLSADEVQQSQLLWLLVCMLDKLYAILPLRL